MKRTTIFVAAFCLLCSSLVAADRTQAATMGHGTFVLDVVGNTTDHTVCQFLTFADETNDVFGTNVNLSTAFGQGIVCLGSTVGGVNQGVVCTSYPDDTLWRSEPVAETRCLDVSCQHQSFVSVSRDDVTGTLPASLGTDVTYSADGEQNFSMVVGSTTIPGCTLPAGTIYRFDGAVSVNAFKGVTTPEGADQSLTFEDTTFYNPLTGAEESVDVGITFSSVTGGGTTTVAAISNTGEEIPADFAYSVAGFQAVFLEISTTATIFPPIEICTSYADIDSDGFLDGTSPPIPESAVSLLHGEGNEFVDRTSSRDPVANEVCATVDSLSPFAVMIRSTGICAAENDPCDDGDACTTVDVCNASLVCVGGGPEPDCSDGDLCTQDVCVSPGGCAHPPALAGSCNTTNTKAGLLVKNDSLATKDMVKFSWIGGSIPLADFGAPNATTEYTLCLSDPEKVILSATAFAGSMCAEAPCWTVSEKGVKYSDKSKPALHDGITQISGSASTDGKSKLQLKLSGTTLPPLNLGIVGYPVTAQVITSTGECWEQAFSSGDEKSNDGSMLKLGHKEP